MRLSEAGSWYGLLVTVLLGASVAAPALAADATDLAVRFTAVSFRNGSTGLYTITVTNNGPAATNEPVTANVTLPAGFFFVSGGNNGFICAASDAGATCVHDAAIASGRSSTLQVRVGVCSSFTRVTTTVNVVYSADTRPINNSYSRVTSVRQGPCLPSPTPTVTRTVTQTPTLTPGSGGPTQTFTLAPTATPTQTPIPAVANLKLTKVSVGQARVGQNHTYALSVANLGSNPTNVPFQVIDTLPNGMSYAGFDGTGWTCSSSGQTVTCTYSPSLANGATVSLTLIVGVGSAAYPTVTNSAFLSYGGDPDTSNNTAHRPTTVRR